MPEPLTRDRIIEALQAMPPNATIDDAIERLVFLAKVETGLAELDGSQAFRTMRPSIALGCNAHMYRRHNRCAILTLFANTLPKILSIMRV